MISGDVGAVDNMGNCNSGVIAHTINVGNLVLQLNKSSLESLSQPYAIMRRSPRPPSPPDMPPRNPTPNSQYRQTPVVTNTQTKSIRELIRDNDITLRTAVEGFKIATSDEMADALNSNAIPFLAELISSNPYSTHAASAVQALASIAVLEETPNGSVEAAIFALVKPLDSLDENILKCACEALRDICFTKDCARRAALDAGAIPLLIRLISHDSTQVKAIAASALRMVCAYGPAAVAAQEKKAVPVVVGLLALNDPEIQRPALQLLSNLCFECNPARLDALHSVQTLVGFIASNDRDIHGVAAQALMNITVLDLAKSASIKAKAIPALAKRIKDSAPDVLTFACGALRNICWAKDGARAKALDVGLVPPLVRLLSYNSAQVQAAAASALSKICAHVQAAEATQKQDAVRVVVGLLSSKDTEVQGSAAFLLSNLCFASDPARIDALELNAIPTLVSLIQSSNTKVQAGAAKALVNINMLADAQQASITANALPALVQLLDRTHSDDTDVLEFACAAVESVCTSDSRIQDIATHAAAVRALSSLLSHKEKQVQTRAKKAWKKIRSK